MGSKDGKLNWLLQETQTMLKYMDLNREYVGYHNDKDDICSETMIELLDNPKLADEIYRDKNRTLLRKLVVSKIFTQTSINNCTTKKDYFTLQKIKNLCTEEGIDMTPSNAYKIAALMKNCDYSIYTIKRLLMDSITRVPFEDKDYNVDFWGEML